MVKISPHLHMYLCILPDTLVYATPPLKCVFHYTTLQFWYIQLLTSNSRYSSVIHNVPRKNLYTLSSAFHVSCKSGNFGHVECWNFCQILPSFIFFTFDAVGSLDYSKSLPTDARTLSVVFAVALDLLKPVACLVLLEYSATAHCWFSHLVSQLCHNTAMEMWWPVWLV